MKKAGRNFAEGREGDNDDGILTWRERRATNVKGQFERFLDISERVSSVPSGG